MTNRGNPRLSGRQAEAARNDQRILVAARAVFIADPEAPISAVAARAGVGISALYRRYHSKEDLLRQLSLDGLYRFLAEAEAALADEREPWDVFVAFMQRVVAADTHALTLHLAGTFTPTEELWREGARAGELGARVLRRAQDAGVVRADIELGDLTMLFEQIAAVAVGDQARTDELRGRYLALMLDALRAPAASPLPGSAPTWEEFSGRFAR
jgi:AcrR family transcriptional regulator